ncbi:uncharacterized protein Z518_02544 [Rhinocladiella mackenziei CBS 650.93]|uniref:Uncharacterized protein n=1 Tax=Rhinocladiella mackenziei CBS 650.93 TaxID=1442369 RepID=A0A0D2JF88_9EURO|nr:uncharacterized protein Z518_02544 [Rhinocladiella mackenziei CBS 650.93]KIX07890.1 hypothetical protein Z518_02544 [Rhinocladiella mackenziei CBS 650.93]
MESASAPGTVDHDSAPPQDEDWYPLTDGHGGFVDVGTLSDQPSPPPQLESEGLYHDDLIGVSISQVQTQMRSPETPAAEKARALNLPLEYFEKFSTLNEAIESDDQQESQTETADNNLKPPPRSRHGRKSVSPDGPTERRSASRDPLTSDRQERFYGQIEPPDLSLDRSYPSQVPSPQEPERTTPPPWEYQVPPQSRHSPNDIHQQDVSQEDAQRPHSHRLSITKTLLSAAGSDGRRRSSSGPTAILSNLRKFLPDLPAGPFNRSSISVLPLSHKTPGQESLVSRSNIPTDRSRTFRWSVREPLERQESNVSGLGVQPERATFHNLTNIPRPGHGLEGNVESVLSPVRPASTKSRARSNSESSLYIRRRVSGVSTYDDINAFANVTDMANSRFKAITDSFQNSTLKLPKLPTMRPSLKRMLSPEQMQAEAPRGVNETSTTSYGRIHHQQYTNVKNIRITTKGIEVETPQQRAHPILSHALSKTTGDIVVLGGYRGSILRSAQPPHRQLWVPLKVGLNLRKVDLEVGLTREDEERMEETIIPSGVLSHIGPIDICRRLLKHLKKCPNTRESKLRVHDWGYDWRLSPDLLSQRLIKFLESLECNHPETPPEKRGATVLAHSLGGIITRHAVNQRPDLFAGVIYAGVPQHCVNILGPLRNGDDVLLSSRVLTAQVNFTLRTSYLLLPEDGRCFIQKHTNKRYDLDFFDPHVWDEYRLSPCINPPLPHSIKDNERAKSIIGALSDSVPLPNIRGSWFGGQSTISSEPSQLEEAANQRAADAAGELGHSTEQVVEPSMKQPQHRSSVATACTIPKDRAEEYLARTLAEVLAFKRQLKHNPSHQEKNLYPPHAYIFGKTVPTVYGARVANREAIKYANAFDDLAFAAGDGVVLASAAQLPEGYRCVKGGRVESDRGHVGILGDLEGVGQCLEAVIDARAKGVGLGEISARNTSSSNGS